VSDEEEDDPAFDPNMTRKKNSVKINVKKTKW
jgi:hypothetical protein